MKGYRYAVDLTMLISEMLPRLAHRATPSLHLYNPSMKSCISSSTRSAEYNPDDPTSDRSEFTETWTFHNYTHKDITVKDRTGIAINVKRKSKADRRGFVIRRHFRLGTHEFDSLLHLLSTQQEFTLAELALIKQSVRKIKLSVFTYAEFVIEYEIPFEDIDTQSKCCYHFQSDRVLFIGSTADAPKHPYQEDFFDTGLFGREEYFDTLKGLNLQIRYVNHEPSPLPKYIRILGEVFTIYPDRCTPINTMATIRPNKTIHANTFFRVYRSRKNEHNQSGVEVFTYTPEQAKDILGICDTYEQALALPSQDEKHKALILQMQSDIELTKLKAVQEKERLQQLSEQRAEQIAQRNHEFDLFKLLAAKEKAEIEQRANQWQAQLAEIKISQAKVEMELAQALSEQKRVEAERKYREDQLAREAKQQDDRLRQIRDEHESTLKRMRDEHAEQLKRESAHLKDTYEAKSLARKDASDSIKMIPALIIGIGTILALLFSKKSS